jgi:hypothetical protein
VSDAGTAYGASDPSIAGDRPADELVLLVPQAMRARRHPRAIAAIWAWQTVLALLASGPTAGLARAALGGDEALWTPGAHALLDWLWHDIHGLRALLNGAEIVLVLAAVAGLVPMAALMAALAYARRDRHAASFAQSVAAGSRAFPAMALLLLLVGLLQGLVVLAGAVIAGAVEGWAHASLGEARAQQLESVVFLLFLAAASQIGVMHDLARAAVVRFRVTGIRALGVGAQTLGRSPVVLWWSWAWRALASVAPVLAAAAVAGKIGGHGGVDLVFLLALHQSVIVVRVALRASWLARALRAVDGSVPPRLSGRMEPALLEAWEPRLS